MKLCFWGRTGQDNPLSTARQLLQYLRHFPPSRRRKNSRVEQDQRFADAHDPVFRSQIYIAAVDTPRHPLPFFSHAIESKAHEQAVMSSLLEAMRSAVGCLLEQSVEWGRIEAANQERRTTMRTNKVRAYNVTAKLI